MALDFTLVLRAEAASAKAEVAGTTQEIKGLTAATEQSTVKSKAAAGAADTEAAAKRRNAQAARDLTTANRQAAGATGNLVAQFNDIGMMMAAGQNPLQLAIQQGTSITQAIGPMGAAGAAKALGGAFMSLLNPINLIIPAVIAAAGYTIQWLTGAEEGALSLEDQIRAVTDAVGDWRDESGKSLSDLRKDFGTITPELVAMQRELNQLRIADVMREAQTAAQGLAGTLDGSLFTLSNQTGNIVDLLGLGANGDVRAALNPAVQEIKGLLAELGQATGVKEQLAAVEQLRTRFADATGGVSQMNAEQRVFYQSVLDTEAALRMAAVATGEVASGTEDAGRAATELAQRAQTVVGTLTAADGSKLVAAFQAAFPAASTLLGMARSIVTTIGGLQVPDPGVGMGRGKSPGGPLVGSADLAALQAGGGVWRTMPVKLPGGGGGGGGGGGAAARDEADALQDLIDSLNDEIATLREHDPIQKEMLKHREVLAEATEAEKLKVEELITTREREKAALEGLQQVSGMAGDALIDALMGADDAGKRLVETLIRAGLEAALLGKGPLAGLFGGADNGGLLGMLFESLMPAVGAGKAAGGMVHGPGDGTKDTFLTPTANGEFIVNSRATARHRHLLEAINSGGRVRGYAEGGYVGGGRGLVGANTTQRPMVQIINQSQEPIREAEGSGPDAEGTVTLIVGKAIGGGKLDRQNRARFGLTPKVTAR